MAQQSYAVPTRRPRQGNPVFCIRKGDVHVRNIVLLLPPAPAALVLVGLALATLSALSAAAFLRMAVLAPPGGEDGRAVLVPDDGGALAGEEGGGDD